MAASCVPAPPCVRAVVAGSPMAGKRKFKLLIDTHAILQVTGGFLLLPAPLAVLRLTTTARSFLVYPSFIGADQLQGRCARVKTLHPDLCFCMQRPGGAWIMASKRLGLCYSSWGGGQP